ncbi:MAG: hypothetical protein WBA92_10105, partial [Pseudorhodobacter sp.]
MRSAFGLITQIDHVSQVVYVASKWNKRFMRHTVIQQNHRAAALRGRIPDAAHLNAPKALINKCNFLLVQKVGRKFRVAQSHISLSIMHFCTAKQLGLQLVFLCAKSDKLPDEGCHCGKPKPGFMPLIFLSSRKEKMGHSANFGHRVAKP